MTSASSWRTRFRSGVAWNALCTVALQGGTFLTNLAVANLVGADEYGRFTFLVATAQTLAAVIQFSTGIAATRYLAEHRILQPGLAAAAMTFCRRVSLTTGLMGSLLLAGFALLGADRVDGFRGMDHLLLVATPIVLCTVMMGFQMGALAGVEGFARSARAMLPLMLLQVASTAWAAHSYGLQGAIWSISANLALRTLVIAHLVRRETAHLPAVQLSAHHNFLRHAFVSFMLPGAVTGLTTLPAIWVAQNSLAQQPDGYTALGLFNAAFAIRGALMILPWIVSSVGFALLSAHASKQSGTDHLGILRFNLVLSGGAALVSGLLVSLVPGTLLVAFGTGFAAASDALRVLMLSLLAEALALPLYQAMASRGRMWVPLVTTQLPRDGLIAGVSMMLIPAWGPLGAAWAHAIGWLWALLAGTIVVTLTARSVARS